MISEIVECFEEVLTVSDLETPEIDRDQEIQNDVLTCRSILRDAKRGIIKDFGELSVFSEFEHSAEIRGMSHGMSIVEINDFYGIVFDDLPENDQVFFCVQFLKGRVTGVHKATKKLFDQMDDKQGVQASLTYLARFADNWEGAKEGTASNVPKALRIELIE